MYCTHCGKSIPDGASFCIYCGSKTEETPIPEDTDLSFTNQEEVSTEQDNPSSIPVPPSGQIPSEPLPDPAFPQQAVKKGSLKVPLIILSVLSAVGLLLFLLFPMSGNSQQIPPEDFYVSASDEMPWFSQLFGSLYFNEYLYAGSQEVTVPETVNGSPVTTIGFSCFYDCDSITTVILPDSLISIEGEAFYDCGALRGIYIPEGVTYIGEEAFANCTALEAIAIPASMELIEASAFDGCSSLKYVFFAGTMEEWDAIYDGTTSSLATAYCTDGQCGLGYKE